MIWRWFGKTLESCLNENSFLNNKLTTSSWHSTLHIFYLQKIPSNSINFTLYDTNWDWHLLLLRTMSLFINVGTNLRNITIVELSAISSKVLKNIYRYPFCCKYQTCRVLFLYFMIPLESSCQFPDEDLTTATKEICLPLKFTPESWYSWRFYMIIRINKNYKKTLPLKSRS